MTSMVDQITYQSDREGHFIKLQARNATDNLRVQVCLSGVAVWRVRLDEGWLGGGGMTRPMANFCYHGRSPPDQNRTRTEQEQIASACYILHGRITDSFTGVVLI